MCFGVTGCRIDCVELFLICVHAIWCAFDLFWNFLDCSHAILGVCLTHFEILRYAVNVRSRRMPRPLLPSWFSVEAERNSKAWQKLLRVFAEIHNSLRSDNGFPLIAQLPPDQELLLRLHMKPAGKQWAGLCGGYLYILVSYPGQFLCDHHLL